MLSSATPALFLLLISGSATSAAGLGQSAQCGGRLFWVNSAGFGAPEGIYSSDPNGDDVQRVGDAGGVFGLAIDPVDRKPYWTDVVYDGVYRSNLDGSDREVIVLYGDEFANPLGIGLDSQARKPLLEFERRAQQLRARRLESGVVDPSAHRRLYGDRRRHVGVEAVPGEPTCSWSLAGQSGWILSAPLVVDTTARGLAVDFSSQKLFWPEWMNPGGPTGVRRANLDGSVDEVHAGPFPDYSLSGIAVDPFGRKVYWGGFLQGGRILRSNLDGTDVEEIVPVWSTNSNDEQSGLILLPS